MAYLTSPLGGDDSGGGRNGGGEMEDGDDQVAIPAGLEDRTFKSPTYALSWRDKLALLKPLSWFMVPLFFVYFAEYCIQTGIQSSLSFGNVAIPRKQQYIYYAFAYQSGVFISRSSVRCFYTRHVWIFSLLQVINFAFLFPATYYQWLPSFYLALAIIFYEGLMGGACYVHSFYGITLEFSDKKREFAMTLASVADSFGILTAAVTSIYIEKFLCGVHPTSCPN